MKIIDFQFFGLQKKKKQSSNYKMCKKEIKLLIVGVFFLLMIFSVSAVTQPTQQYNKLFLSPFYTTTLDKNTNYSYDLEISTPDGVAETVNALVTFQVYSTVSGQEFYLWVDGEPCNNPLFLATEKGLTFATYECSNRILGDGDYMITVSSDKDGGSAIGWVDFTYVNNPKGELHVWGTEYRAGEKARVFLQLRDAQGLPEENGDCHIDIYYPQQVNATASVFVNDAPMLHLEGSEGIYYYDINTLPNVTGVYMMTAGCNYQLSNAFIYYADGTDSYSPTRVSLQGTSTGSTIVLNAYTDYTYTKCVASGGGTKTCQSEFDFDTTVHFDNTTNVTDLALYYMGEASINAYQTFEAYNFTNSSWYMLPNSLTFSGNSPVAPVGLNDFASNTIPNTEDFINASGIIRIRVTSMSGTSFQVYHNWLNINLKTASGTVQELKGSSEIHVNDWFDYYRQSYTDSVWENFTGNITPNILDQIANSSAEAVWQYNETVNPSLLEQIGMGVWNVFNSTYDFLSLISARVWNFDNRNLTYYEDVTNYSNVAKYVWEYDDRNLTFYQVNNISVDDIWTYYNRNLTFYEDTTNYSKIADYVWMYVNRNLTTEYINNISAEEIWSYYNRSLTDNISMQVWSYPNRNLTTDIPFEVWSYENRTLTYYTLNLSELIDQINDYDFSQDSIPLGDITDSYESSQLNVILYVQK